MLASDLLTLPAISSLVYLSFPNLFAGLPLSAGLTNCLKSAFVVLKLGLPKIASISFESGNNSLSLLVCAPMSISLFDSSLVGFLGMANGFLTGSVDHSLVLMPANGLCPLDILSFACSTAFPAIASAIGSPTLLRSPPPRIHSLSSLLSVGISVGINVSFPSISTPILISVATLPSLVGNGPKKPIPFFEPSGLTSGFFTWLRLVAQLGSALPLDGNVDSDSESFSCPVLGTVVDFPESKEAFFFNIGKASPNILTSSSSVLPNFLLFIYLNASCNPSSLDNSGYIDNNSASVAFGSFFTPASNLFKVCLVTFGETIFSGIVFVLSCVSIYCDITVLFVGNFH